MKLLTEVLDFNELTRIRILFGEKGIPIFVGNENSAKNMGFIYPARKYSIFVVHDQQFNDAVLLLENENHEVKTEIDAGEYQKFIDDTSTEASNHLFKLIIKYAAMFFAFAFIMIFLISKYLFRI